MIRIFGWSFAVTAIALIGAGILGGLQALVLVAILIVLEISLSFDNAVVNATILRRMSPAWQRVFLTVGILIAVVGMRLLFPLVLVAVTARIDPVEVVALALQGGSIETPGTYAHLLHDAHPSIAAFGGMFLLMLFLDFVFEDREIRWLTWLERPLARIGSLDTISVVGALVLLLVAGNLFGHLEQVLIAGVCGIVAYLLVNGLGSLFEAGGDDEAEEAELPGIHGDAVEVDDVVARTGGPGGARAVAGRAAFFLFLYLEVLDASFSFDGVIGAFAITQDIFIVAVGLGVGALYIRSITVYLVRRGTLSEYVYLEHGAHWAIGALAIILLVSIGIAVPEVVTGLIGVAFIGAAFLSSLERNRRIAHEERAETLTSRV